MLTRTFCHVPGLGAHTERELWRQGCTSWAKFLAAPADFSVGGCDRAMVADEIQKSVEALEAGHHQFFQKALGTREAWRAWPEFRRRCLYLDIETDGGMSGDSITCVGLYDGKAFRCLVAGEDLALFPDLVSYYGLIVTFFGTGFDLPMLRRAFHNFHQDQIHLDLCPTLKRVGYRGGLKKIEKQLGIERPGATDGLDGRDAIRLWRMYQHGDRSALDTLIAYNQEDVVNMERLAEIAYDKLARSTLREAGQEQLLDGQEALV